MVRPQVALNGHVWLAVVLACNRVHVTEIGGAHFHRIAPP